MNYYYNIYIYIIFFYFTWFLPTSMTVPYLQQKDTKSPVRGWRCLGSLPRPGPSNACLYARGSLDLAGNPRVCAGGENKSGWQKVAFRAPIPSKSMWLFFSDPWMVDFYGRLCRYIYQKRPIDGMGNGRKTATTMAVKKCQVLTGNHPQLGTSWHLWAPEWNNCRAFSWPFGMMRFPYFFTLWDLWGAWPFQLCVEMLVTLRKTLFLKLFHNV